MSDPQELREAVLARLSTVIDPETGVDVVRKHNELRCISCCRTINGRLLLWQIDADPCTISEQMYIK